jgi:hypothetical protein
MSEEFDRAAWILTFIGELKDYEINNITELRVQSDERRPSIIESIRDAVLTAYADGDVAPRYPSDAAHQIADGMVPDNTGDRVVEFSIIEAVLALKVGEDGLSAEPGTTMPDLLGDALHVVYDQGMVLLLTHIEQAADDAEQEWEEEHPETEETEETEEGE